MGRNLYILAASLTLFALISCGVAYTNIAQQPGSPGDASLWRTMGLVLFLIALVVALAGILSSLFEQAERHAEESAPSPRTDCRGASIFAAAGLRVGEYNQEGREPTRMFEVTVEAGFSSGHYLRNYHGKCENPHGHNYRVLVTLAGAELDEAGLLLDFKLLKNLLKPVVDYLDHRMINDLRPSPS